MAIVSSVGSLQAVQALAPSLAVAGSGGNAWTQGYDHDPLTYAAIYRTQPNVRTCVDFIARNMAHLGIHVFRRVSDTDRVRLADHEIAEWLAHPTPFVTRYRLIESLLQDLGIYWNAFWLKLRLPNRIGLQRLPPYEVLPVGGLMPAFFRWTTANGDVYDFPPSEIVAFNGYHPTNPLLGLSPLETLRRVLAEDVAATAHRESFWRNAARIEGVVERPLAAKSWNDTQVDSFKTQWAAKFTGAAGVGQVPVLQEGMTFKPIAFSPRQTEYTTARKLTREEVAAAYHIPLPMVGILDHATFSNITEQHKNLYQDTLGPWCEWLAQEFERQLLPECDDADRVYVEFNIAEKLRGSFEEQAAALQTLVGAPIMTRNEGRGRLNLPALDEPGADRLVRPLNTTTEPEALDAADAPPTPAPAAAPPAAPDDASVAIAPVLARTWERQAAALRKIEPADRAHVFDDDRWTRELARDLLPAYVAAGYDEPDARQHAERLARIVNTDTRTRLDAALAPFTPHRERAYVP